MTHILSKPDPVFVTACLTCSFLACFQQCLRVSIGIQGCSKIINVEIGSMVVKMVNGLERPIQRL